MKSDVTFFYELAISFLPFIVFAFLNSVVNIKKEKRSRQYAMIFFALIYSIVIIFYLNQLTAFIIETISSYSASYEHYSAFIPQELINNPYSSQSVCYLMVIVNTVVLMAYVSCKLILNMIFGKVKISKYLSHKKTARFQTGSFSYAG